MKRALIIAGLSLALASLVACGGGSSSSKTTSGLKKRAFVTNAYSGFIEIIDYTKDEPYIGLGFYAGGTPQKIVLSGDHKFAIINDASSNSVYRTDTTQETVDATVAMPAPVTGMVLSQDGKKAWVATRNAPVTGKQNGAVQYVDYTATTITPTAISVPLAGNVFLNNSGSKILATTDGLNQAGQSQVTIIDTATNNVTVVAGTPATGLDHPTWAVFSSDDSKAYIVNCGAECGGTTASVSVLDMSTGIITANVAPAGFVGSVALLDGSNLYVAGSTPSGIGQLYVLSTSSATPTVAKGPVEIGDGFHTLMTLASNNKLFIGANPCSNIPTNAGEPGKGCLSIYDTSAGTAVVDQAHGFVTGMTPIPSRSIVYVTEGGELQIYDTTTSTLYGGKFIDVVGQAYDVKVIDQ